MKTIRNVHHDLQPIIKNMQEKLILLHSVPSISDLVKLADSLQDSTFLVEKYLDALEKEAKEHGIEKG